MIFVTRELSNDAITLTHVRPFEEYTSGGKRNMVALELSRIPRPLRHHVVVTEWFPLLSSCIGCDAAEAVHVSVQRGLRTKRF